MKNNLDSAKNRINLDPFHLKNILTNNNKLDSLQNSFINSSSARNNHSANISNRRLINENS